LKFSFRETEIKSGEIKIYNSTGQLVKRVKLVNSNSIIVNCNEFSNGVYYYTFSEINNTSISGKFIVSK
jgi:phage gp45-like